jgi:hypothetical protein
VLTVVEEPDLVVVEPAATAAELPPTTNSTDRRSAEVSFFIFRFPKVEMEAEDREKSHAVA